MAKIIIIAPPKKKEIIYIRCEYESARPFIANTVCESPQCRNKKQGVPIKCKKYILRMNGLIESPDPMEIVEKNLEPPAITDGSIKILKKKKNRKKKNETKQTARSHKTKS